MVSHSSTVYLAVDRRGAGGGGVALSLLAARHRLSAPTWRAPATALAASIAGVERVAELRSVDQVEQITCSRVHTPIVIRSIGIG
jgi:hypothetical protein